jgi:hypothetical protein
MANPRQSPQAARSPEQITMHRQMAPARPMGRLQARGALKIDEEEDSEDDELLYGGKRPKKESLADMLSMDPPWAASESPSMPPASSAKLSKVTGTFNTMPKQLAAATSFPNIAATSQDQPKRQQAKSINGDRSRRLLPKDERAAPVGSKHLMLVFCLVLCHSKRLKQHLNTANSLLKPLLRIQTMKTACLLSRLNRAACRSRAAARNLLIDFGQ